MTGRRRRRRATDMGPRSSISCGRAAPICGSTARRWIGDLRVLAERISYAWRVVGTGLAFAAFGLGGVALAMTVIPLAVMMTRDPARRTRRAQAIIRASLQTFV